MPPSKREEIIQATINLVSECGFHGAPTIKIAEKAGVAELTIFRNFKTKEQLFDVIFDELRSRMNDYVTADHDTSQSIKDRFFVLCNRFCSYMETWPKKINFMEQYYHSAQGWHRRHDIINDVDPSFRDYPMMALLDEGRKMGEIKNLPLTVLIGVVVGPLFNFERHQQFKKTRHSKQMQEQAIQACWDGVSK